MDYAAMATFLNHRSLEELREINRLVVNQINGVHREQAHKALMRFKVGDTVEFVSDKHRRKVRMKVERINAKSLGGAEVTADGRPGLNWRVSPNLCQIVLKA